MMTKSDLSFRQGNPNLLMFEIIRAGQSFVPDGSRRVLAELRLTETSHPAATVELTGHDQFCSGMLPINLEPKLYFLALRLLEADQPLYRVGAGKLQIYPVGALVNVTSGQTLVVSVSETNTLISLTLDDSPSAAIAASYAAQAQALVGNVMTLVEQDDDSITLGFGGSIQVDNHPDDLFPYLEIDLL